MFLDSVGFSKVPNFRLCRLIDGDCNILSQKVSHVNLFATLNLLFYNVSREETFVYVTVTFWLRRCTTFFYVFYVEFRLWCCSQTGFFFCLVWQGCYGLNCYLSARPFLFYEDFVPLLGRVSQIYRAYISHFSYTEKNNQYQQQNFKNH